MIKSAKSTSIFYKRKAPVKYLLSRSIPRPQRSYPILSSERLGLTPVRHYSFPRATQSTPLLPASTCRRNRLDSTKRFFQSTTSSSHIKSFFEPQSGTLSHVIWCKKSRKAAVIDSVLGYDMISGLTSDSAYRSIREFVHKEKLDLRWILETHVHADHLTAAPLFKKDFPQAQVGISKNIQKVYQKFAPMFNFETDVKLQGKFFDVLFEDHQEINVGDLLLKARPTPGHTPACLTYTLKDECAFVGDTIFHPDCGTARCDFPGGSAQQLFESLSRTLSAPESSLLFLAHDYPKDREVVHVVTVKDQLKHNIHFKEFIGKFDQPANFEIFRNFRENRDKQLSLPKLIIPSIQVNIRGGYFPQKENGTTFLKTPVNSFLTNGPKNEPNY